MMSSLKSSSSTSLPFTSKRKRGNASALKHKECAQNFRSNKNKEIQAIRTLEVFFFNTFICLLEFYLISFKFLLGTIFGN